MILEVVVDGALFPKRMIACGFGSGFFSAFLLGSSSCGCSAFLACIFVRLRGRFLGCASLRVIVACCPFYLPKAIPDRTFPSNCL